MRVLHQMAAAELNGATAAQVSAESHPERISRMLREPRNARLDLSQAATAAPVQRGLHPAAKGALIGALREIAARARKEI